ncbi:MAG TPA: hypothetical protein VLZ06_05205 [Solirubrobacteraceae bacterium]|nr:hypothetical protein [Solirubrobacteraceae bacterium]
MHKRIVGASVVAALAAVAACTGIASGATSLRLQVGGTLLPAGAPIVASSTNTTVANAFWALTCTEGTLTGTLGQNNRPKNDFISITAGQFAGGGNEGLCSSTFEFVTAWMPQNPPEFILEKKGNADLRFPGLRMTPLEDIEKPRGHHESCVALSNAVKGTFPLSATPQPLTVTFTNVKMRLGANHGAECGSKKGHSPMMSATFSFTSEGQGVDVVSYEH